MLLHVPEVLDKAAVARVRKLIDPANWVDGNVTSGVQSALAKSNRQLPEDSAAARDAGAIILDALEKQPLFVAGALPLRVFPPLFNRYGPGHKFDTHVDNAIRVKRGDDFRIRSDLSATLFLSEPEDYDGGELSIEDTYGVHQVKLAAGDLILYADHAGRAGREFLLASIHDPRRREARAAVADGSGHSNARAERRPRPCADREPHRRLSQSPAHVG
jgi:PKHD-type hydroxylase